MNPAGMRDLHGFAWTYEMIVGQKHAEMIRNACTNLQRHWWRSTLYVCNWTCPVCVRRPAATVDNQSQAGMGRKASAEGPQRRNQWPRARALVVLFISCTLTTEMRTLFNSSAYSSCFEILHCIHRRDSGSQPWILGRSQHWRPSSILNQHLTFLCFCQAFLSTSSIWIDCLAKTEQSIGLTWADGMWKLLVAIKSWLSLWDVNCTIVYDTFLECHPGFNCWSCWSKGGEFSPAFFAASMWARRLTLLSNLSDPTRWCEKLRRRRS